MLIEVKIPSVGESVQEAILAQWYKQDGDTVSRDEPLFVIETDKITLEIEAEADGRLKILVAEGETVKIGTVVGTIDSETVEKMPETPAPPAAEVVAQAVESPAAGTQEAPARPAPAEQGVPIALPPSVRRLVAENDIDVTRVRGSGPGGRITKGDVMLYLEGRPKADIAPPRSVQQPESRALSAVVANETPETRQTMSPIRRRIAERLLEAKQKTAMLTTFNEIDMDRVMAIRNRYKDPFQGQYGVSLGFMSFFIKACVSALNRFPALNAFIDGDEVIYHHYQHIGIAVGGEKGLVVPVIRHAEQMSFAQLEKAIVDYVDKIKENRLALADLEGGTFTITNGGVYGSLLSTPILNTPQSGILGMHKIEKRPVVVDDQVVIRPMMYVALSYDHRIVDGREAVTFLKRIKACIEDPERMLLEI